MQKESWEYFFQSVKPLKGNCEIIVKTQVVQEAPNLIPNLHNDTKQKYSNQNCIDLHNHTISEAYEALRLFLNRAGSCALTVITGRGSRTGDESIKDSFIKWSTYGTFCDLITQIIPIKDYRGQVGAFRVILKKNKPKRKTVIAK